MLNFIFSLLGSIILVSGLTCDEDFQNGQDSNSLVFLYEPSGERKNDNTDFSLINFKSESLIDNQVLNLADKILLENGDVVCIQNISSDEDGNNLYELLKKNYTYSLYMSPKEDSKGMLLVSKYSIKKYQYNPFLDEINGGFFDFLIENDNVFLGHIYAINWMKNDFEQNTSLKLTKIAERIRDDMKKCLNGTMPYILFGGLNNPQISPEIKTDLEKLFDPNEDGINSILLLRFVAINSIDNSEYGMFSGIDNRFTNYEASREPCKNASARSFRDRDSDRDSGGSFKGGIECEWGGKGGVEFNGYVGGEYHDSNGNYLEGKIEQNNKGEGKFDVHGGHKNERDSWRD